MADILVCENITGDAMVQLQRDFEVAFEPDLWNFPDRLRQMICAVSALIVRNQTQVTADLIAAARQLKIIGRAGAGVDNIDTAAASESGVVVSYAPRENSVSVAELTIGLMLALARKIPQAVRDTREGGWNRRQFTGIELSNRMLGVVGLGRIGTLTATRAKAFGMRIIAHDELLDPETAQVRELDAQLVGLDELLSQADFVSCHIPLTQQTRAMFGYRRFCQMKPHAVFINTSRGEVVDEAGLIRALQEQRIAGAALDVRSREPPGHSPLDAMDNVLLTPHIAAFTQEAQQRVVAAVCQDVAAVLRGKKAVNYFNFPQPQ